MVDNIVEYVEVLVEFGNGVFFDFIIDVFYVFINCEIFIFLNVCVIIEDKFYFMIVEDILDICM